MVARKMPRYSPGATASREPHAEQVSRRARTLGKLPAAGLASRCVLRSVYESSGKGDHQRTCLKPRVGRRCGENPIVPLLALLLSRVLLLQGRTRMNRADPRDHLVVLFRENLHRRPPHAVFRLTLRVDHSHGCHQESPFKKDRTIHLAATRPAI